MSGDALNTRLEALSDLLKQTQSLINRLSKLPSQSASGLPHSSSPDIRLDLGEEIHQNLKELQQDFELFQQDAEDLTNSLKHPPYGRSVTNQGDRERTELGHRAIKFGEDLKIARAQYRKAQLIAKRNPLATQRKDRDTLFASPEGVAGDRHSSYGRRKTQDTLSQDDILLHASNDITASLTRTHNLLSAELQRSQFARETLETSTKELSGLYESYSNLDNLLNSSRSFLSTLIASQKSDTWYLQNAFYILCVLIAWLVFRRILYGPGWWLLYLPLRLLWNLSLKLVQVLILGLSVLAGSLGLSKESKILDQENLRLSSKIVSTATARGKSEIPTFQSGMSAPSIRAGAGGSGAKVGSEKSKNTESTMIDRVGKIIESSDQLAPGTEASRGSETKLRERREDELPNPKKKVWIETSEVADSDNQEKKPKDEL